MSDSGFSACDFLRGFEASKLAFQKGLRQRGLNRNSITTAALFIRFLQLQGQLPLPAALPCAGEVWPVLGEFRSWMHQHRGVTETTLDTYQGILMDLREALGEDTGTYSAEALRTFIFKRARPHGMQRARTIVVAVRSFVRFMGATGRCVAGMEHAIPSFASWQLSSTPRFLAMEEVEQVIGSCTGYAFELRDRAVLLLLSRLGLRASEVAQLKLLDVDWRNGSITVCGKGRRHELLPLPQEVGDAILLYLNKGRPNLQVPEVFASVLAPFRPLNRASVTHIVRSALRRAGIDAPINGAHVLRHSAATSMLRRGASLAAIGAVLRHRSPRTTAHYAKVDFGLLSEIAQKWPEVSSC
jgi:site-specific recombinase XerD